MRARNSDSSGSSTLYAIWVAAVEGKESIRNWQVILADRAQVRLRSRKFTKELIIYLFIYSFIYKFSRRMQ